MLALHNWISISLINLFLIWWWKLNSCVDFCINCDNFYGYVDLDKWMNERIIIWIIGQIYTLESVLKLVKPKEEVKSTNLSKWRIKLPHSKLWFDTRIEWEYFKLSNCPYWCQLEFGL